MASARGALPDPPTSLLLRIWESQPVEYRPLFACFGQRWWRFFLLARVYPPPWTELLQLAFDRYRVPVVEGVAHEAAFQKLLYLLELPPFPTIDASDAIIASAHERINQGLVRLIMVAEDDGQERLLVRQNAGMSKSKLHDTWVALVTPRPAVLPLPVCDCVNWYVLAWAAVLLH
jgi:hypothetical protein